MSTVLFIVPLTNETIIYAHSVRKVDTEKTSNATSSFFIYVYVLESKKKIVCLEFGTLNEEKPVIEKITVFHFSFIEINVSI